MKILALDCATRTGWALIEDGKVLDSGMRNFKRGKFDHSGKIFQDFSEFASSAAMDHDPDFIVYEQAHHRGGAATRICVGMTANVERIGSYYDIPVDSIHSAKIKLYATGNGRASKDEMKARAWEILGRIPVDDNEADAVLLGLCACKMWIGK